MSAQNKISNSYWENPQLISENKEDAHATLIPYLNYDKAIAGNREKPTIHKSQR